MKKLIKKIPEIKNEFVYGKKSIFDDNEVVIGISSENSEYCEGAINRGYDEESAIAIFEAMAEFARYSFNKAHSGSYAAIAYKTAWLSCYYPVEWAIACLTSHEGNQEKMTATLSLAKRRGITVKPPSVCYSESDFTMEVDNNGEKGIRYGLLGIKDVGDAAIKYLSKVREDYGVFKNFDDFYNTVHSSHYIEMFSEKINKKNIKSCPIGKRAEEALIKAGAFDEFETNRYKLLNYYLIKIKKVKDFEAFNEKDFVRKTKLALEKEVMGSYISEHPLEPFPYCDLDSASHNDTVETTGIIIKTTIKNTKKDTKFANILVETKDGKERKIMAFGKVFDNNKDKFKKNNIIVVKGTYNSDFSNINAKNIKLVVAKKDVIRNDEDELGVEDMSNVARDPMLDMKIEVKADPMDMYQMPMLT